jgi:type 1 glutamine amidotransferase
MHAHAKRIAGWQAVGWMAVVGALLTLVVSVSPAGAADTSSPVLAAGTFASAVDGNNNWRITTPQTLNLSATDDVAVSKFQYSLDGGVTYVDVPVTPGVSATAAVPLSLEGNTTVRYRAVDSSGNFSRGATANTTLNQAAAAGATGVRLTSTTGRSAGDLLVIDTGAGQETATIATIVTPAPPSPAPNVTLTAPLANAHAAAAAVQGIATYLTIALLIDSKGPVATWGTQATTLQAAAASGATQIRLASTTGRATGDVLQVDQGPNAETATIASIVTPNPAAPAPNVVLAGALTNAHLSGSAVYLPAIVGGTILQSRTLTPLRTDPRLRDATDTVSNGAGGAAPRRMTLDGVVVIPKDQPLNRLTVGKHVQTVALQDTAGSVLKYTNTFVVTTSFTDLDTVLTQYAGNALATTLNGAQAIGATGLRLGTPFGFREGQTLHDDSGANQETVTIGKVLIPPPTVNTTMSAAAAAGATSIRLASYTTATTGGPNAPTNNGPIALQPIVLGTGATQEVISVKSHVVPVPAAPAPNVILSSPLLYDHAAGTATTLANVILSAPLTKAHASGSAASNPRPFVDPAVVANLKTLLAAATAANTAGNAAGAVDALNQFKAAVLAQVTTGAERAALTSAADSLISQVQGGTVDTSGTGVTVGPADPGDQAIRVFWNPTPFVHNPGATYKILVDGRAGGFRHQAIVDAEAMFQKLGAENGVDVDIYDPNINGSPGRQAPVGVSLATSPFLDLATLSQYKTIVMNSTVGLNAAGLSFTEFGNLQAFVRAGGGVIAIHGGTDSMQNVPWYMDLVGAGFTNHGSNAGGILIDTESGGHVELVNADPGSTATAAMPDRFFTVDELYNTNRDPVSTGIGHPLVYENEDTLVGQLGYGPGPLMNTDKHAMVWCRNFDGGRSFTTTLNHSWLFNTENWFQQQLLAAVKWTAGVGYMNCVTFVEVSDLVAAAVAAGSISSADGAVLNGYLAAARVEFDQGDYAESNVEVRKFVARTQELGAAQLTAKGNELISWANGFDEIDPVTTAELASPSVGGYYHDPTVTLSASDVWSGVASTSYSLDGGASKTYTAPFKVTGDGPHTLTYYSTDVNGNVEDTKTLTFSIDTTPPVLTVSEDKVVEATGPNGAVVTYAAPTALDAIAGPVTATCTPASGSTFPLGHTSVLCTATDPAGNLGTKSFDVHVPHTIAPNVVTSPDVVAEATSAAGAKVTYPDATATDIVDGPLPATCSPASGSTFALGDTIVTCTAKNSFNVVGSSTFHVLVRDTTAPVVEPHDDVTVDATGPDGATVTFAVFANDAVDGHFAASCVPPSGSVFAIGSKVVRCTATDAHTNTSTPVSFNVTVRGAVAQLQALHDLLDSFDLKKNQDKKFDNTIDNALKQLAKHHDQQACGRLDDYLKKVANEIGKRLTADEAAQVTAAGARIQAVLGC